VPEPLKSTTIDEEEAKQPRPVPDQDEDRSERRSMRERRTGFFRAHPHAKWIIAIVALVLIAAGIFVWHYYSVRESTDDAQIDGHIDPISARVSGTVLKVYYDDNQQVKAGDLLVELDPKDYEVALARAKADLANAEANAAAARVGVPLTTTTSSSQLAAADAAVNAANREIESARARVQEAQANYTKAADDLKRMEQLVQKDEVSRQQYDASVAAANASKATLAAADAAVATAEGRAAQARAQADSAHTVPEQIKVTRAKSEAAAAEVERDKAALAQAELNLQYTKVTAPVDGILSKRSVEPGQVVQAGQPLFAIVNLDDIWVTANFKETQLKNMRVGQQVQIGVDAFGKDYKGTLESIGGATGARFSLLPPENATGNYVKVVQRIPVRIRINKGQDPNHTLRPGMSVVPTVFVK
jgi:membrane fusion protein (multidrug efflux system)